MCGRNQVCICLFVCFVFHIMELESWLQLKILEHLNGVSEPLFRKWTKMIPRLWDSVRESVFKCEKTENYRLVWSSMRGWEHLFKACSDEDDSLKELRPYPDDNEEEEEKEEEGWSTCTRLTHNSICSPDTRTCNGLCRFHWNFKKAPWGQEPAHPSVEYTTDFFRSCFIWSVTVSQL